MDEPGLTCHVEACQTSSSTSSSFSRSTSANSDVSTQTTKSQCSARTAESLGDRVVIARPGLVIVRNAEGISIDSVCSSDPSVMLFYPGCPVLKNVEDRLSFDYTSTCKCRSPLAMQLLKLKGVERVTLTSDHIQVKKICHEHKDSKSQRFCSVSWRNLKPQVLATLLDFFASGLPVIEDDSSNYDSFLPLSEEDTTLIVRDLIEKRIRPLVQQEGGDIQLIEYRKFDRTVFLSLAGTCVSSPAATKVLRNVIWQLLQFYVPEIGGIIEVPSSSAPEVG